ncbi:MAG: hypothetical protein U1F83_19240 [Verrucomicrobiota bacterium]
MKTSRSVACSDWVTLRPRGPIALAGLFLAAFLVVAFIGPYAGGQVSAQPSQPAQSVDLDALTWPRFYATNGYEFAIYQPQISDWPGNQLSGRFVVAVRPAGTSNETYGVVFFQARTEIDKVNRLVTLEEFQMTRLDFPTQKKMQPQYRALLESFQHHAVKVIPLDHLEAVFAASADITKAKIQAVKNDPPRVIYTTQPSLLILVDGAPIFKPLVGDYQRVVNTRAILLLNTNSLYPGYYLFAGSRWHTAPSLEGPWAITYTPPPDTVAALDAALATKQVDPMYPKNGEVPAVLHIYVSTVPTELVETTGAPNLLAVSGTDLLYVENTSNAIFYYLDDGQYYVLISGRWFKSASLNGPYAFVPAGQLPADFNNIPADHEKSNVLASVPGTPQSQEAVIANSIPQTATIKRDQAKLTVDYFGAPSFTPITGTKLLYAANTATPVVMVNANTYYACEGGVWFKATAATTVGGGHFGARAVYIDPCQLPDSLRHLRLRLWFHANGCLRWVHAGLRRNRGRSRRRGGLRHGLLLPARDHRHFVRVLSTHVWLRREHGDGSGGGFCVRLLRRAQFELLLRAVLGLLPLGHALRLQLYPRERELDELLYALGHFGSRHRQLRLQSLHRQRVGQSQRQHLQSLHRHARRSKWQCDLQSLHGQCRRVAEWFLVQSLQWCERQCQQFGQREPLQRKLQRQPPGFRLQSHHWLQLQRVLQHFRKCLQRELQRQPAGQLQQRSHWRECFRTEKRFG